MDDEHGTVKLVGLQCAFSGNSGTTTNFCVVTPVVLCENRELWRVAAMDNPFGVVFLSSNFFRCLLLW